MQKDKAELEVMRMTKEKHSVLHQIAMNPLHYTAFP